MQPRRYFPLGKAYGGAFCNRVDELSELKGNIINGKHTFLAAPRRYGKSSLCEKAMSGLNIPAAKIDLHVATSEKSIERIIFRGITELIGKTVGAVDKAIQKVKHSFKYIKPTLSYEVAGFELKLEVVDKATVPESIREAILLLENILQGRKQQAVLLIDEFQRVAEIAPDMGIEGGIRSAAQETEYLSIIFSGSNRHLIELIFQDEGRPLYKLCKKIKLPRITTAHYKNHLNKAAKKMWETALSDDVIDEIMTLTERHPYYVNYICDSIWSSCKRPPRVVDVVKSWDRVVEEERSDLLREFYNLAENAKKLLIYFASGNTGNIYSAESAKQMGMPSSSVSRALYVLQQSDLIEEETKGIYRLINPAFKSLFIE